MTWAPLLLPDLDAVTVERFASMLDERVAVSAELARGVLLEEPIVSPTGKVVGTRVVANPAVAMLRQIDRELDQLADRLAVVPSARARIGVSLTTAEKQAVEVQNLLDSGSSPWMPRDARSARPQRQ